MSRLAGFFDCLLPRRFLTSEENGRARDAQSTAHEGIQSNGYHSEPIPTAWPQEAGPPSRAATFDSALGRPVRQDRGTEFVASNGHFLIDDEMAPDNRRVSPESSLEFDIPLSGSSVCSDEDNSSSDFNDKNVSAARRDVGYYYQMRVPSPPQPIRPLSQRDMAVIGALFPHPNFHPIPRETKWRHFMSTMAKLGFSSKGTGGAAYCFTVSRMSDLFPAESRGSSITEHMPHPRTTLDRGRMREIGRKLTSAYGWTAETFIALGN
ncbi:hypothetical protein GGR58DRAFT_527999 [Xylaria digitata]|nr:hypothetical protein GGR58DRAFT_527999 [Xylaria digitata]